MLMFYFRFYRAFNTDVKTDFLQLFAYCPSCRIKSQIREHITTTAIMFPNKKITKRAIEMLNGNIRHTSKCPLRGIL